MAAGVFLQAVYATVGDPTTSFQADLCFMAALLYACVFIFLLLKILGFILGEIKRLTGE
jgi:hypothetical protein